VQRDVEYHSSVAGFGSQAAQYMYSNYDTHVCNATWLA